MFKTFNVEQHKVLDGAVVALNMAIPDPQAPAAKLEKLTCQATQGKVKYTFTLKNRQGDTQDISAGVLRSYLAQTMTDKEAGKIIDKLYNIGYNDGKGNGSHRATVAEKAAMVDTFLSA